MENRIISESERNNKAAMTAHIIEVVVMLIFCLLQTAEGLRTGVLFLFDIILGIAPIIAEAYFWKKDRDTAMIKHLVGYGFAVFYTYTLFTSSNNMVFVFVIPMILMVSIFNDTAYAIKINCGTVIISFLVNALGAKTGKMGYEGMDDAIIMVVVMLLVAAFSFYSAKISRANSNQKLNQAQEARKESEKLLADMSFISEKLHDGIKDIYGELEKLIKSSDVTKESIQTISAISQEVSAHANETASAEQENVSIIYSIDKRMQDLIQYIKM